MRPPTLPAAFTLVLLAAAGCAPASPDPTGTPSVPPASASATTAPPPNSPPTTASPGVPPPAQVPSAPPPVPTAPAASTAGALTEADVAIPDGWSPTARPGSPDEGYLGNGTWVHATSPEHSAFAAISLGCTDLAGYPVPVAALEGTLVDPDGSAGVGLVLEFAAEADARAYFAEWVRQAEACVGTATEKVSATADTWVGRRRLETLWSETVGLRGSRVALLIVDDPAADLAGVLG